MLSSVDSRIEYMCQKLYVMFDLKLGHVSGLSDTAITLVQEAVDGKDTRGLTGAVGGVLRQIPPTLIAPVILASEATSTVIDGVSHQLVPDCRHEALNKWKY